VAIIVTITHSRHGMPYPMGSDQLSECGTDAGSPCDPVTMSAPAFAIILVMLGGAALARSLRFGVYRATATG
jgi:hypothetical protein